ncbi:MFS transporter [Providencia vermicola]|uniref:MFS transporter n=1 Tax=Providencia vermicola TaxID=333965 RepID=UPI003D2A823C
MEQGAITLDKENKWIKSVNEVSSRVWLGLLGIFFAVMSSGIGEGASKIALADIQGKLFLDIDKGSWVTTCYVIGFILGASFTPNLWPTFSLRRVALTSTVLYFITSILIPIFDSDYRVVLALRSLQGIGGGALPPMLMVGVLRFMPPLIKVLGLSIYSWAAAWGITMGATVASVAFHWGVDGYFYWNLPFMALAIILIGIGIPQDPLNRERLKKFNWRGLLLGGTSLILLTIGISQGERLDWFNSLLISISLIGGTGLFIAFLINEWFHPIPFFNLQLLKTRNLAFALISLGGATLVMFALANITSTYLISIQGYRQEQIADLMHWIALPQIIFIPIIATLCNSPRVDCRWVLATSLLLMGTAALLSAQLTSTWNKENFYLIAILQAAAQPMATIPLLMLATGSVKPMDGPYAAAMFNAVRAFAAILAGGIIPLLTRQRADFHEVSVNTSLISEPSTITNWDPILVSESIIEQSKVLAYSDNYIMVIGIILFIFILNFIYPTRIYPPYILKNQ